MAKLIKIGLLLALLAPSRAGAAIVRDAAAPFQQRNATALSETFTLPSCNTGANTITLICAQWGGASNSFGTAPACGGTTFTSVPKVLQNTSGNLFNCWYAFCGVNTGTSVTITANVTGANAETAFCYDNVNTSTPFDSTNMAAAAVTSTTPITSSAITGGPTVANDMYVMVGESSSSAITYSANANSTLGGSYTNWQETASTSSDVSDALNPASGVTIPGSTATISASATGHAVGMLLEVKPAAIGYTSSVLSTTLSLDNNYLGASAGGSATPPASLTAGTLTVPVLLNGTGACPTVGHPINAATGATCYSSTITATNTDNIVVYLALTIPASPKGTIVIFGGIPEQDFPETGAGANFANDWVTDGFEVVQVAFASSPLNTTTPGAHGAMTTAARAAGVVLYAYNNYTGGQTRPLGGFGFSQGSGQILYSCLNYGLCSGGNLKAIELAAASPWGDHVGGCETNATPTFLNSGAWVGAPSSGAHPCAGKSAAAIGLTSGSFIDNSDGTSTCDGTHNGAANSAADKLVWTASTPANNTLSNFSFTTKVSVYECVDFNVAAGNGVATLSQIPAGAYTDIECNSTTAAVDHCTGEPYWVSTNSEYTVVRHRLTCDLAGVNC